jgi:hypothetical protein
MGHRGQNRLVIWAAVAAIAGLLAIPIGGGVADVIVGKLYDSRNKATWKEEASVREGLRRWLAVGVAVAGATPMVLAAYRSVVRVRDCKVGDATAQSSPVVMTLTSATRERRWQFSLGALFELTAVVAIGIVVTRFPHVGARLVAPIVMLAVGRRRPDALPIVVPLSLAAVFLFGVLPVFFIDFGRIPGGCYLGMNPEDWFGTTFWFIISGTALATFFEVFSLVRYRTTRKRYFLVAASIDALSLLGFLALGYRMFFW